jgi:hypothetical protein
MVMGIILKPNSPSFVQDFLMLTATFNNVALFNLKKEVFRREGLSESK